MSNELISPISKALVPVVRSICYHPNYLRLSERAAGNMLDLVFYPHMADIGLLIGRGGRQAKALSYLGDRMGERMGIEAKVSIVESYQGDREPDRDFVADPEFGRAAVESRLWPIIDLCFDQRPIHDFVDSRDTLKFRFNISRDEQSIIQAIGDLFFPFGKTNGRRIEIKANVTEEAAK